MSVQRAGLLFLWFFALSIAASSLQGLFGADNAPWIRILAGAEIIAAALLLIRPVRMIGLFALLAVFAAAGVHHIGAGDVPFEFGVYAASMILAVFAISRGERRG